jgi:hypothetical protein
MDPALNIVPDYSKTAQELFVEIADQHIQWDRRRWPSLSALANDLELAFGGHDRNEWKGAVHAVRQRVLEAIVFHHKLEKQPDLTKDEFLADWNLSIQPT